MAQDTTWTGAVLTESDINAKLMHEDAAWTSYTPTLAQTATVTKTVNFAHYGRAARTIFGHIYMTVSGAGTAGANIIIGLPVAATGNNGMCVGTGFIVDSSATLQYMGALILISSTTVAIAPNGFANYLGNSSMTAGLANTDIVSMQFTYEAVT